MPAATYSAGTAFLTVVPSFLHIEKAMGDQVRKMAEKVDKTTAAALAKGMAEGARRAKGSGEKAGEKWAGAYERSIKKGLETGWKSIAEPEPGVNLRKWDKALLQVRKDMKELSEQKIGPDIDEATLVTSVARIRQRLQELINTAPRTNDRGFFNAQQAEQQLGKIAGFMEEVGRRGEEVSARVASAFETKMQRALKDGLAAVPKVELDADASPAQRKLQQLRDDMESLASKTIGVDIDAAQAFAELKRIESQLRALDRLSVNVDVRTDAHQAAAGMSSFIRQAEHADQSVRKIGHAANFSISRLGYLIALGASIGTSIVPAALAAAAAVGAIGTAGIAGVAGLGVFALGVSGIADAVKALNKYEQDRAKSANSLSQAQRRLAGSADQVRMAELSLANTRANIADAAFDAAQRVGDAERNLAEARRDAGREATESARRVRDAQRDVTRAEQDAREVREALNRAIRDATRDMAELDTALGRNKVEQDQATTAQMAALEALKRLQINPRATEVELRRATDAVNEQTQRLAELKLEREKLIDQQQRYVKQGVEGDDQVVAARKRVADADERVAEAQERLARSREQQAEQQYDSAQRIADAQRQLADAQRAQARQQRDAAYQLAQALHGVESAQRSAATSAEQLGVAGGESLQTLNEEMSQLTPTGQRFARFLFGLKDEALALRAAASDPLLPGLQEAITLGLRYLPGITRFVRNVSGELGRLAVQSVKSLGSPVWQRFFRFVDAEAVPSLQVMFEVGSNMAEGLVSLWLALTPFNRPIGRGLIEMSEDFARWAREMQRSQGYRDFLDYVRENGPKVIEFLGEAGELLIDLVKAAMPIGSIVLSILTEFIDLLNSIPTPALVVLVGTIALLSLGIMTLGAVMRALKFRQQLIDIFGPPMSRMVNTYAIETGRATQETGRFGKAVATTGGMAAAARDRIGGLRNSMSSLGSFVGGPWGVALIAGTTIMGDFAAKAAEQKAKVETLTGALLTLADAYDDFQAGSTDAVESLVRSNKGLQDLILNASKYGLQIRDITDAIKGDTTARDRLIGSYNTEIRRLEDLFVKYKEREDWFGSNAEAQAILTEAGVKSGDELYERIKQLGVERDALVASVEANEKAGRAIEVLTGKTERANDVARIYNYSANQGVEAQRNLASQYDANANRISILEGLLAAFSDAEATATDRANAMRSAIENQTSAVVNAIEAEEDFARNLIDLREQVNSAKAAHDKHATSLDLNSATALRNRDALEQAASAVREMYLADIAAGKPMDEVTRRHNERIKALKEEAKRLGLDKEATEELIKAYGDVPDKVKTIYETKGFEVVFDELRKLQFAQYALKHGMDPKAAAKAFEASMKGGYGGDPRYFKATGGLITGPGTETSDDIPIWASKNEFMQPANAVHYYGVDFMESIRKRQIPKEAVQGYATGGLITQDGRPAMKDGLAAYARGGRVLEYKQPFDAKVTKVPTLDEVLAVVGTLGGQTGGRGWQWQMKVLRAAFPGLALYSGYRKNSYTASGSLSWHSRDGGRAVDIPPRGDVFRFIHDTYGKGTKELIWGGNPGQNIYNGRHYRFNDTLLYQHGPYRGQQGPSPHIHWAYDQGGYLMPGYSSVWNGTGAPEAVLNTSQWADIHKLAMAGTNNTLPGNTYNITYRDIDLTAAQLRAMQQRDELLARVGRPY